METRWTVRLEDGTVKCAHCDHYYGAFNYLVILLHCREYHRDFYRHKWETEVVGRGDPAMAGFAPLGGE